MTTRIAHRGLVPTTCIVKTRHGLAHRGRRRGFGLIDVSLAIIAGVVGLIGSVILFNQINTNSQVADVTRNAVAISSEIRGLARNFDRFSNFNIAANLSNLGLEPAMIRNVTYAAETNASAPDSFRLTFTDLRNQVCRRLAASPGNLGLNATTTNNCANGTLVVTYTR